MCIAVYPSVMRFETKAVHSGAGADDETGAIAAPIHLSTTFERRAEDGEPSHGFSYIRDGNPTQLRLEEALAAIDSGSHVVLQDESYYGVRALANEYLNRWGLTFDFVAMDDLDGVKASVRSSTRAIWCESPSNPLMRIADVSALARIAHEARA